MVHQRLISVPGRRSLMKGILSAIALIVVFSALGFLPSASASSSYGPSWEEHCIGNTCTRTLYSGMMFGYEDSEWKPVEELRSFVGTTNIKCVVKKDNETDPDVECLDYNYTSIRLKITDGKKYKLKVYDKDDKTALKSGNMDKADGEFVVDSSSDYAFGDVIHIGDNSTTVQINSGPDDAPVNESAPDTNYGSTSKFAMQSVGENKTYAYYKFDISSMPVDVIIDSVDFDWLMEKSPNVDYEARHVYNQTWTEETITWNNQPCGINITDDTNCNLTATDIYNPGGSGGSLGYNSNLFDLLVPFKIDYDASNSNFSIVINATPNEPFRDVTFKEHQSNAANIDITYRLKLNFTVDNPLNQTYSSLPINLNLTTSVQADACWYNLNGGSNTFLSNDSTTNWFVEMNPAEGVYQLNVYCNTTTNGLNSENTSIWFTYDPTSPTMAIHHPENTTYGSTSRWMNFTYSDTSPESCWYDYDGTNTTISGFSNTSFTALDNQQSTIWLWINDTAGNYNGTSQTFTVDTTPPTYSAPTYDASVEEGVNNTISIVSSDISSVTATIDIDGTNHTMTTSTNTHTYNFSKAVVSDETIYFRIYLNDTVSNANMTGQYSFQVYGSPGEGGGGGDTGGGGGGSSFIVYGPDCGDYRATPADFSGASEPGTEMGMFILKIRNGADEQSFDATLSDNLRSFCGFDGDTHIELLPNMEGEFRFQCEAPNGTISGYLEFRSSTGCVDSRPVVISGGLGTWADISYSVMLLGVGDISGLFNEVELPYVGFGVPFGALLIIIFLIIVGVVMWIQSQ